MNELQLDKTDKTKKVFSERPGDWQCFKCKNLNFAFRKRCNRCPTLKKESEELDEGLLTVEESPYDYEVQQQMHNQNYVENKNQVSSKTVYTIDTKYYYFIKI